MPFGLKNAPATFQRVIDNVLRGLLNDKCLVYLDDIIVFSTSLQEHIQRLREVFERLRKANLKIQLDKCKFLQRKVKYLGHIVTPSGVKPDPSKINAIQNYPLPKSQKEIKQFLGLLGYYRKFIKDFAKLTKPLTNYSTTEKELLSIVFATRYFRPYLYGRPFHIYCDHQPLQWILSLKEPSSKLLRWRLKLEEYDYKIIYKEGSLNTNADGLSRIELNMNETIEKIDGIFKYMREFNKGFEKPKVENESLIVEIENSDYENQDIIEISDDEQTIHSNFEGNTVIGMPIVDTILV